MKFIKIFHPFFEKNYKKLNPQNNPYNAAMLAVVASIVVSLFLSSSKFLAFYITNSVSMRLFAIDSLSDMLRSLVILIAIYISSRKVSKKYTYGYGKIENCAVILQSFAVVYLVFMILYETYHSIMEHGESIEIVNSFARAFIVVLSLISLFALISFQKFITEKTTSLAVKFDYMHYKADFYMNISAVLSLFLSHKFWFVDIIFTIFVCGFLLHNVFEIFICAVEGILDASLSDENLHIINEILQKNFEIKKINKIQTRSIGLIKHININVSVNVANVQDVLVMSESIKKEINKIIHNSQIVIEIGA